MPGDTISLLHIPFFHSLGGVELCPSGTAVSNGHTFRHPDARWMNMEHHWNWKENSEVLRSSSQYHYVHHKPHVICAWMKLRLPRYRWRPTARIMARPLYILTKLKQAKSRAGVHKRGIQVAMATSLNFVGWPVIYGGPGYGTCLMSPFWPLKCPSFDQIFFSVHPAY